MLFKEEKRKLFLKTKIAFCSVFLAVEMPNLASSIIKAEEFYKNSEYSTILTWDYLSVDNKETLILRKIKESLKENESIPYKIKGELVNSYSEYLEECIQYITKEHYKEILESSKTINLEILKEPFQKEDGTFLAGWFDKETNTIYSLDDKDTIFHEKLHADYDWKKVPDKEHIYNEMHSSLFSKVGYTDINSMFRLIGELVGTDVLTENIVKRTPNKIWDKLESMYPENKESVKEMNELVETIFEKRYSNQEEARKEKNDFWNLYSKLYYEKFSYFPESDIIGKFLKEKMFYETPLVNYSDIEYESTYYIGDFEIPLKDRKRNYKDVIIEELFNKKSVAAIYFQRLWRESMLGIHKKDNLSYQEYESSLKDFFGEEEIKNLFNQMITCETEEQFETYKRWIHANIFSTFGPEIKEEQKEITLVRK